MAQSTNGILDKKKLIQLIGSRLTGDVEKQRVENVRLKFETRILELQKQGCDDSEVIDVAYSFQMQIKAINKVMLDVIETQVMKLGVDLSTNLTLFIDRVADLINTELESLQNYIAREVVQREKFMSLELFYDKVYLWMKAIWDAQNPQPDIEEDVEEVFQPPQKPMPVKKIISAEKQATTTEILQPEVTDEYEEMRKQIINNKIQYMKLVDSGKIKDEEKLVDMR